MQPLIPTKIFKNLPEIVKREISFPKLNLKTLESGNERKQTTLRIVSMLDVKFSGESDEERIQDRKLAMSEFTTFLRSFNLTGPEVVEAYRMALTGEINYKVYPTLSLIQAGEILEAYKEFKYSSAIRDKAMRALKALNEPKKDLSPEEIEFHEMETFKRIYSKIKATGFSEETHILYDQLENAGKLKNWNKANRRSFFNRVRVKYIEEIKLEANSGKASALMVKSKLKNESFINAMVKSRCREIFVCNYLKKHIGSFEEFINAIKN